MFREGRQRADAGEDVVIGWVERHGRAATKSQRQGLEIIPPTTVEYRGIPFQEVDVEGIIKRGPDLVLIDELAHAYPDGRRKRWEDVAEILDAGIPVITTVNVANLYSVRDYAARITGAGTVEAVPDEFVRSGDVILIDLPPEALRRRIAAGRIYSFEYSGGALANYFRASNLAALSELGMAWMNGTVDEVGEALLARSGDSLQPPRPVVIAGISGSEWSETVLREAAERAAENDADLLAVHVNVTDGLGRRPGDLDRYRQLTEEVGGSFLEVTGTDPADALAQAARARNTTRVVVARHRSRLEELLLRGSIASRLRRLLPGVEVTTVSRKQVREEQAEEEAAEDAEEAAEEASPAGLD
jgi:two-component system sensor histidine kinase KdpD